MNGQMTEKTHIESVEKEMLGILDAIFESSFDGIWICDSIGNVLRINRASERINGINAKEVLGKNMKELVKQGMVDHSATLQVLKTKKTVSVIQKPSKGKQILATGSPVINDNGNISFVVVNERDLTELNRLRNELKEHQVITQKAIAEMSGLAEQKKLLSNLTIKNKKMTRLISMALKLAQVESTVVIGGESGVGKGVFAKLIHQGSKRRKGPFLRIDCGTIPETLIESEFFGYEEGAFTGARNKGKIGLIEMSNHGTLFLDEIGELPLLLQVKLLRFLEDKELVRVGGSITRNIDTRIIAATNRNLEKMVSRKEFRKDLFFRLNVVALEIPPLRERVEDIPPLINRFLDQFNQQYNKKKVILSDAVDCICNYSFPGNIRELSNIIENLVVMNPVDEIKMRDLPARVQCMNYDMPKSEKDEWNLPIAVNKLERQMILSALKTFGNQTKAATRLGLVQSTLSRKIKRYEIHQYYRMHNLSDYR